MIHLLYLDENPEMFMIVAAFCERIRSFMVKILNSGESALAWLSTSSTDVIVSDYDMHGDINGIRLLQELHSRGTTTPVILFTALGANNVREEAYRNGAFSVINKPRQAKTRSTVLSEQYTGLHCRQGIKEKYRS